MKKVMILGGSYFQLTVIKAAKKLGYYTITCDYLPDNIGHKYSDEYHNVSFIDKESVLELAIKLQIDGIVCYASDASAITAAYVAEKIGLPGNPVKSVEILTKKDLFKEFLKENGFYIPKSRGFNNEKDAYEYFKHLNTTVMIKPIDASGSKGVSRVSIKSDFKSAYDLAMEYSLSKNIIVEEYMQRNGYQIAGDAFIVNGDVKFLGLMNEHFDKMCNPFVPIGESYPSIITEKLKIKSKSEIQRLVTLLGIKNGAINLDFIFDAELNFIFLEVGARSGGNLITDAIYCSCNVNLAEYVVKAAVGDLCDDLNEKEHEICVSSYIIHTIKDGIFKKIEISDEIKDNVILCDLFVKPGEEVKIFNNSNFAIGAMLIKDNDIENLTYKMDNMEKYITVILE